MDPLSRSSVEEKPYQFIPSLLRMTFRIQQKGYSTRDETRARTGAVPPEPSNEAGHSYTKEVNSESRHRQATVLEQLILLERGRQGKIRFTNSRGQAYTNVARQELLAAMSISSLVSGARVSSVSSSVGG